MGILQEFKKVEDELGDLVKLCEKDPMEWLRDTQKESKTCCGWAAKYERETGKKVKGFCSGCGE